MTNRFELGTVAVLGASALGCRFASAALRAGYRTILEDFRADVLERAVREVGKSFVAPEDHALLSVARTVEDGCREANLVIDTTLDDAELKLEIFTLLDKFARPGAVCATIAASIAIAELGKITYRPELCVGLRIGNHSSHAEILTIIRAAQTSEAAVSACLEFARRVGWQSTVELEAIPSGTESGS
ncbi:MAG: 3-hydroxyacyl-CoA dehydrogenase NAD-binding domain-containing protein [Candidatus Acidiferrales bacterium]